jgi:hypothetical protein
MKRTLGVFAMAATMACGPASAWDSKIGNPTHPTHSYLTEWAITHVRHAEVTQFAAALIDGANAEMHELPIKGSMYGFDLEKLRLAHKGTNAGTDDIAGWWRASLSAYQAGKKQQAYFLVGIMLHMVEDMGVPAHANGVYHQGTLREFDNFEFLALSNWKPDFAAVNKTDPAYADPSAYYAFSQAWTHEDAPDYHDRNSFSKTWITASAAERTLLRNREARSATVARWTLDSAYRTFHGG